MSTASQAASPVARITVRRVAAAVLLACLAVFALDALLFRTGLYPSILEPDSLTGQFELILARERQAQARGGDNLVLTIGDSRVDYYPRVANQLTPETGYVFRDASLAGSDPRVWYYMLRDLDPQARRYRAIVIAVGDYDDEDGAYGIVDEPVVSRHVIARLRLPDLFQFAGAFEGWEARWQAFRGALFKGLVYQSDIQAFIEAPARRLAVVRVSREGFPNWTYDYVGPTRSLAGLQVDWSSWKVTWPPAVEPNVRERVERYLMYRPEPQTGHTAAFRRASLGRILDRYRGSRTRIVFVRLPRGPIPRPANLVRKLSSSIREFAARPGVLLCEEHAFDSLEQPKMFLDAFHMNHPGSQRFSELLPREIRKLLGPAEAGDREAMAQHAL